MNTIESNKLIACFMGGKFRDESRMTERIAPQDIWLPIHGICRWDTIETGSGKRLHYHDSWDWLMPVVEKIESTMNSDERIGGYYDFDILSTGVIVEDMLGNQITSVLQEDYKELGKINSVYKCVVEFIQWDNNQK